MGWNEYCCCCLVSKCCLRLFYNSFYDSFTTPQTAAHQAPRSMGFPKQEYWSGLLFSSPVYLPTSGIQFESPVLACRIFTTEPPGKTVLDLKEQLLSFTILIILNYQKMYGVIAVSKFLSKMLCPYSFVNTSVPKGN